MSTEDQNFSPCLFNYQIPIMNILSSQYHKILFCLLCAIFTTQVSCQSDKESFNDPIADSLWTKIKNSQHDLIKMDSLQDILVEYCDSIGHTRCLVLTHTDQFVIKQLTGKLNEAKFHAGEAIKNAKKAGYWYGLAFVYSGMANIHHLQGKIDSSLILYRKAQSYTAKVERENWPPHFNNNFGIYFYNVGNLDSAYHYASLSLQQNAAIDNKHAVANGHGNLANIFLKAYNYERAESHIKEGLAICDTTQWPILYGILNSKYGNILSHKNQYEEAKSKALIALSSFKKSKRKNHINDTYSLLANIYTTTGEYVLAKIALDSITDTEEIQDNEEKFSRYLTEFDYYLRVNNVDDAQVKFNTLQDMLPNIRHLRHRIRYHKLESDMYKGSSNTANYNTSLVQYHLLKDSMENLQRIGSIENLEAKYQSDKKKAEIERLALEDKLSQSKISRQRLALGGGLLALSILALFSYRLLQKNKIIDKQNNEKDILLKEIHHRVKNNLQVISSLLGMQSRSLDDEKAKEALKEGRTRVHSMSLIHQELYNKDALSGIDMSVYTPKLCKNLIETYGIESNIRLETNINPLTLDIETVIPIGLIINELITNALKYAFTNKAEGVIKVQLNESQNTLILSVKDNGAGMPEHQSQNIEGGFGYTLISAFRKKLNAQIDIDGSAGTTVTIHIKNYKKIK